MQEERMVGGQPRDSFNPGRRVDWIVGDLAPCRGGEMVEEFEIYETESLATLRARSC